MCDLLAKCRYGFPSDNGRPPLSQASQYATLLPAVYSSFSSNTEYLLQVGNSHLKHLYLVLMKQEQHISITLCDVSNDFRHSLPAFSSPKAVLRLVSTKRSASCGEENSCIPGREIVLMLVRGGNSFW